MNGNIFEVIVIGAGPAGLMCSYYLKHLGLEHILFDQGRIGESWRSQRWSNFRMITPMRSSLLPGSLLKSRKPDAYGTAGDMISLLQEYVSSYQLPVTEQAQVLSVGKATNSPVFQVKVLHDNEVTRTYDAWQVIMAVGSSNRPYIPRIGGSLPASLQQIHSSQYTREDRLAPGGVLIVGGGQSGMEIAQDLVSQGRKVWLSALPQWQLPRRYRGREIFQWLLESGLSDHGELNTGYQNGPVVNYEIDETSSLDRISLTSRGVNLLGPIEATDGLRITFASWTPEDVRMAREASDSVLHAIDRYIEREKLEAPVESALRDDVTPPAVTILDLKLEQVNTVVWATGYGSSFSKIECPLTQEQLATHNKGVTCIEGLYVVGEKRMAGSDYVASAKNEASFVTNHIYGILR